MLAYMAVFACALSGYAGAPAWTIAAGAIALAAVSYSANATSYGRASELGLARVASLGLLRSLFNSLIAAGGAFIGGWTLNWL